MKCFIRGVIRGMWYVPLLITYHLPRLYACPLCKDALTPGMAKGFYWSILLMLGVPAIVVGLITFTLWRAHGRRQQP
jgi:hypothetical protein